MSFTPQQHADVAAAISTLLHAVGAPEDEHTQGTPGRVARAWEHRLKGYAENPADHLGVTFPTDPGAEPGSLVAVHGIEVHSTCAHHLLPITGHATVAYVPRGGRVVGLSKLSRLVDGYARRLQVQERIGQQVAGALADRLDAVAAACIITADHGCMKVRGVQQQQTATTTLATAGHPFEPAVWQLVLSQHRQGA